ncbi:MAG TPA: endonuclease, partial [Saprospiraceae bacterium]|nr:endonuclease [Saprospiraceae bacterium]
IRIKHDSALSEGTAMRVGKPHHLVPCKSNINTLRRNAPFGEILDDKTKYWILDDKVFIRPDKRFLDNYSESTSGFFEPREDKKGDIARSLFYFFTVYGQNITKKNRSFFTPCFSNSIIGIGPIK